VHFPGSVSLILLSPIVGGTLLFFVPSKRPGLIKAISLASSILALAFSVWAFLAYDREAGGYQMIDRIPWVPSLGISYTVGADGINAVLLLMTGLLGFTGVWVARSVTERVKEYFIFYLFLIAGCFGVLCSLNIFFLYFFYETAVIPVYPLIAAWGSGDRKFAAMKLTLYLTLGAVAALLAIIGLYFAAGAHTFDLPELQRLLSAAPLPLSFQRWAFPFVMVGFGVILTLWPFHTWSPIGYASAPTSVSMLHAGVLKKLGAYAILRIGIGLMPEGAALWMPWVSWIALINILYCGLAAFAQKDLKFILGYASCSHMGFILLGLSCLTPLALQGTVFFMFAHGLMAALGFALVGFIYEQTHTRLVDDWGGLGKKMPFIGTLFVMTAMASLGLPGFANFVGEILILLAAWERYPLQAIFALLGLIVTAGFMLQMVRRSIQGPLNPRWDTLKDARGIQRTPYLLLILVLVVVGVLPRLLMPTITAGTKTLSHSLVASQGKVSDVR